MNEIIEKENIKIEDMIFEVRRKQVTKDKDLARLYQVETRIDAYNKSNSKKKY